MLIGFLWGGLLIMNLELMHNEIIDKLRNQIKFKRWPGEIYLSPFFFVF